MTMTPEERAREIAERIVRMNTFVYSDSGQPGFFANIIPAIASALLAEREAAQPQWRSIDSAPKDGTQVLVAAPGLETGPVTLAAYVRIEDRDDKGRFKSGVWFPADWKGWLGIDGDGGGSWCEPTHWMPLPPPPTDAGGGEG